MFVDGDNDDNDERTPVLAAETTARDSSATNVLSPKVEILERQRRDPPSVVLVRSVLVILILSRSIDYVLYVRLAHHMNEYTWLLATFFIPFAFLLLLTPIVVYRMRAGLISQKMRSIHWQYFAIIGFVDMISNLLGIIPAPFVAGPVQVIFSQLVIIMNMIVSYFYLNYRFKRTHYFGVLLIFAGVFVATAHTLRTTATAWYWCLLLVCKAVPSAVSNVLKEEGLKYVLDDVYYFNFWVVIWQLVTGVVTVWFVFIPILSGRASGPIKVHDFPTYISNGFTCFTGRNPVATDKLCHDTPYVFTVFICINVFFNVIMLLTFKLTSSTLALVASALRVALSAFMFTIVFISGPAYRVLTIYDAIALCILLTGLAIYQRNPETVDAAATPLVRSVKEYATPRLNRKTIDDNL